MHACACRQAGKHASSAGRQAGRAAAGTQAARQAGSGQAGSARAVLVDRVMIPPRDSSKMADYRHRVLTHDNKNPMFCVIAYSPSKKLSLAQNSICMNLAGLNLWILYR